MRLLRRHVRGRAGDDAFARMRDVRLRRHDFRKAEVEHLGAAVTRHENVRRLEIAMEDALLMCDVKSVGDLQRQADGLGRCQRPAQRHALDVLQDEIARTDVVDLTDVRMVQCGNGARLVLEATDAIRVSGKLLRQDLDSDITTKACVVRAIDLTHPASAKEGDDVVRAEASTRCQGHLKSTIDSSYLALGRLIIDASRGCSAR